MNTEVPPFAWAAFVDNTYERIVPVKERSSRHARRQILLNFVKLDAMSDWKPGNLPLPDIDSVARAEARRTDCGQLFTNRDSLGGALEFEIFGGG